jgi:hypothetical protein
MAALAPLGSASRAITPLSMFPTPRAAIRFLRCCVADAASYGVRERAAAWAGTLMLHVTYDASGCYPVDKATSSLSLRYINCAPRGQVRAALPQPS